MASPWGSGQALPLIKSASLHGCSCHTSSHRSQVTETNTIMMKTLELLGVTHRGTGTGSKRGLLGKQWAVGAEPVFTAPSSPAPRSAGPSE